MENAVDGEEMKTLAEINLWLKESEVSKDVIENGHLFHWHGYGERENTIDIPGRWSAHVYPLVADGTALEEYVWVSGMDDVFHLPVSQRLKIFTRQCLQARDDLRSVIAKQQNTDKEG